MSKKQITDYKELYEEQCNYARSLEKNAKESMNLIETLRRKIAYLEDLIESNNPNETNKNIKKENKFISKGEQICFDVLKEEFPGYEFVKTRPKWLINPETKKRLELDMYNNKLKLAIEFNGKQHYNVSKLYHKKGEKSLSKQVRRDIQKRKICDSLGIHLITIHYKSDIKDVLKEEIAYYKLNSTHYIPLEFPENDNSNIEASSNEEDETDHDENEFDKLIRKLKSKRPDWYITKRFVSKNDMYLKLIAFANIEVKNNIFWKRMNKILVYEEKYARKNGGREVQIKLNKLW